MRYLKLIFCAFLLLIFCECNDGKMRSDLDRRSDSIIIKFDRHVRKYGFYAVGSGGSVNDEKITSVDISFNINEVMDLKTARKHIVFLVNALVDQINTNPTNSNYFEKFPVDRNIVKISILGKTPESSIDHIVHVFWLPSRNKIYYSTDDPVVMPFLDVHEETFEEAEAILNKK